MDALFQLIDNAKSPQQKLQEAIEASNVAGVSNILTSGFDVNKPLDKYPENRALHVAARLGDLEIVKLLLEAGAQVDVENIVEQTPLSEVVRRRHDKVAEMLVIATPNLRGSSLDSWGQVFSKVLNSFPLYLVKLVFKVAYKSADSDFKSNEEKVTKQLQERNLYDAENPQSESLKKFLMEMKTQPFSLSHICRLTIRSSFQNRRNVYYDIQRLNYPQKLKNYLIFEGEI